MNSKMLSMFGQGGSMFGVELMDIAKENENIIVLSTDVSTPAGLDKFKSTFPDKFMNMGIAESNMIGTAAGLCDEGFQTIAVAQSCFISMRCFEQIRQYVGYMQTPQILVGFGSGFSLSLMGNTHYSLEDIALMKTVPDLNIVAPCDAMEATKALREAIESKCPTYIRLYGGTGTPIVYPDDCDFKIGKAIKLKEGDQLQILATGSMVIQALKAATILEENGISAEVVDMHTIKPLDTSAINLNAELIVTIEEHRITGGLGSSIADYLVERKSHPKLLKIAVPNSFSKVGSYEYLLTENGLDVESIVKKIINNI